LYGLYGFDVSQDLTNDVMHTLALCIFKMYVHMVMKYAEGNLKMKDLEVAMNNVKKLRPRSGQGT